MKKNYFFIFSFSIFFQSYLSAAIYCEIDTTVPLKCSFSCNHPNRIMVEKQGVEKIIHSEPDNIQILIEEKANQAFVIVREEIKEPITLCVITSTGDVQDLEVTFKPQPSQLVILQQRKPVLKLEQFESLEGVDGCQIQTIINTLLMGQFPVGFWEMDFFSNPSWLRKKVKVIEVNRFEKEDELIRVFKISNCSKRCQTIFEKELTTENASWIFLEKNKLLSGETMVAIISIKKDLR